MDTVIFQSSSEDRIQKWLESAADVNIIIDKYNWRPIHFIAYYGYDRCLSLAIELGANVNARTITDDTPLIYSCAWGHLKCVDILVQSGADKNYVSAHNTTAFSAAAWRNRNECIRYLFNSGFRATGDLALADERVKTTLINRRHAKDSILFFETLLRKRLGVCKDMANVIGRMMWEMKK
jgi:hypothetical protein